MSTCASTRLRQVNLVNAEVIPQDSTSRQQATLTKDNKTSNTTSITEKSEQDQCPPQPPQNVVRQLDPQQRKSFNRLWPRISENLRMIRFGLDKAAWLPQHIDTLGDTLCELEYRFPKYSTDLGHVTVDPLPDRSQTRRATREAEALPPLASSRREGLHRN